MVCEELFFWDVPFKHNSILLLLLKHNNNRSAATIRSNQVANQSSNMSLVIYSIGQFTGLLFWIFTVSNSLIMTQCSSSVRWKSSQEKQVGIWFFQLWGMTVLHDKQARFHCLILVPAVFPSSQWQSRHTTGETRRVTSGILSVLTVDKVMFLHYHQSCTVELCITTQLDLSW